VFDKWVELGSPGWGWDDLYPLAVKVCTSAGLIQDHDHD
jgi:hypothetical protein